MWRGCSECLTRRGRLHRIHRDGSEGRDESAAADRESRQRSRGGGTDIGGARQFIDARESVVGVARPELGAVAECAGGEEPMVKKYLYTEEKKSRIDRLGPIAQW